MITRQTLILAFFTLTTSMAQSSAYKNETIKKLVQKDKDGVIFLEIKDLDREIENLTAHAGSYPPKFDSEADKNRAQQDIIYLSEVLEPAVNSAKPDPEILWRTGLISAMGYNLDLPGMSRTAEAVFKKALELKPDHMQANFHYGVFLANRLEFKKAQYYLKEAQSLGHKEAEFSLGLTYLGVGDKAKALETLNSYQKKNPNKDISRMISSIEKTAPDAFKK